MHHSLAGRLNGSDFALLVPSSQPKKIAENLMKDVIKATKKYTQNNEIGSIGLTQYHKGVTLGDLLNQLDVALATAESQGKNSVVVADLEENPAFPKTLEAWAKLIKQVLKEKNKRAYEREREIDNDKNIEKIIIYPDNFEGKKKF